LGANSAIAFTLPDRMRSAFNGGAFGTIGGVGEYFGCWASKPVANINNAITLIELLHIPIPDLNF
jgi:hypothetical protein